MREGQREGEGKRDAEIQREREERERERTQETVALRMLRKYGLINIQTCN